MAETFAFNPTAPLQTRPSATGVSHGAEIVGGNSQGGVVSTTQQTSPGPTAGPLGEYFGELMKPYVERKQQEKFFEGYTAAESGQALSELTTNNSPITKIFGPTGYEKGAQFYTASAAVDKWQTDRLSEMDDLKRLKPEDVSKVLSTSSRAMMTADPYVNQLIQGKLIELSGPLINTVAKQRIEWQQSEMVRKVTTAWDSSAAALQKLAGHQAAVTDPASPEGVALKTQMTNFLGGMSVPYGMTETSYKKAMTSFLLSSQVQGNFHGYEALVSHGVLDLLDPADRKRVEEGYDRYSKVGNSAAMANHIPELLQIEEGKAKRKLSPLEAVAALDRVNASIARETGIRDPAFNAKALFEQGNSVISMLAADSKQQEERQYAARVREENRTYEAGVRAQERVLDKQDQIADEQLKFNHAVTAGSLGKWGSFAMAGGDHAAVEAAGKQAYDTGNFALLAKNVDTESYIVAGLPAIMQAKLTSAAGREFTADAKQGFDEWTKLYAISPSAAASYYGDSHGKLLNMAGLIKGHVPIAQAYIRAFGGDDAAKHSAAMLDPATRKEAGKAIGDYLDSGQSYWFNPFGRAHMNASARQVMTNVITEQVALGQRNSDVPLAGLVKQYGDAAIASNRFEGYGEFGWRNAPGTPKLSDVLHIPGESLDKVLYDEIDSRLKGVGVAAGAGADSFEIVRSNVNGHVVLNVFAPNNKMVHITEQQLRDRKNGVAAAALRNHPTGHLLTDVANRGGIR